MRTPKHTSSRRTTVALAVTAASLVWLRHRAFDGGLGAGVVEDPSSSFGRRLQAIGNRLEAASVVMPSFENVNVENAGHGRPRASGRRLEESYAPSGGGRDSSLGRRLKSACSKLLEAAGVVILPQSENTRHGLQLQLQAQASNNNGRRLQESNSPLLECNYRERFRRRGDVSDVQSSSRSMVTLDEFYSSKHCFHDLSRNVAYFHVGKGGGGNVERMLHESRVAVSISHPGPSPVQVQALRKGPLNTLIFNVRDPVDRWLSAYYWALDKLCGVQMQKRSAGCRAMAARDPYRVQKEEDEHNLLSVKYRGDANVLAEAICEDSPNRSEALEDFNSMGFMGHKRPLSSWLQFLIDPSMDEAQGIQNFIAVPMEKNANGEMLFDQHIERMTYHLLGGRYGEENAREIITSRPPDVEEEEEMLQRFEHAAKKGKLLGPLGECCLARQLYTDYQLIQTMLGEDDAGGGTLVRPLVYAHPALRHACDWGGSEEQRELCRADLRSMLARRARYLDQSLGTCRDVVSSGPVQIQL